MKDVNGTAEAVIEAAVPAVDVSAVPAPDTAEAPRRARGGARPRRERRPAGRKERSRSEFDSKIISIRRVARVMAGGRRFSFSVALVAGDRKGSVGVGIGKAGDTALAIDKAMRSAKKHMVKIPLDKDMRIAHDVSGKHCASVVSIIPSPRRGLVAGSSVRTVLELGGVKDVTAKLFSRSKNGLNNALAAVKALSKLS